MQVAGAAPELSSARSTGHPCRCPVPAAGSVPALAATASPWLPVPGAPRTRGQSFVWGAWRAWDQGHRRWSGSCPSPTQQLLPGCSAQGGLVNPAGPAPAKAGRALPHGVSWHSTGGPLGGPRQSLALSAERRRLLSQPLLTHCWHAGVPMFPSDTGAAAVAQGGQSWCCGMAPLCSPPCPWGFLLPSGSQPVLGVPPCADPAVSPCVS